MVTITSPALYFQKITNARAEDAKYAEEHKGLAALKTAIETSLSLPGSLSAYLSDLSTQDKSRLLKAFLLNNQDEIREMLFEPIKQIYPNLERTPNALRYLVELSSADEDNFQYLSGTVLAITSVMLSDLDIKNKAYVVKTAMQLIPDTQLSISAKFSLVQSIDNNISREIDEYLDDYAYTALLPILDANKFKGNISKKEYAAICENKNLDISEFIICTLGVLQSYTSGLPAAIIYLNEIRHLYDTLNYDGALVKFKIYCGKFRDLIGESLANLILNNPVMLDAPRYKKPTVNENFVRRYYENLLAQLATNEIVLAKVNKISSFLIGITASSLEELPGLISAATMKKTDKLMKRHSKHTAGMLRLHSRDRVSRGSFTPKFSELKSATGDTVFSQNPGVMASNQPNFFDATTPESIRNKTVDQYTDAGETNPLDPKKFSAYAASISGHAFYLIALLEEYMEVNKFDPCLEDDINEYVKAVILGYINLSFHTYLEMVESFEQPHIVAVFKSFNVTLDLTWLPRIVEQATLDTQEYAKTLCLKQSVMAEIKALKEETLRPKFEIDTKARAMLMSHITYAKSQLDSNIDKAQLFKQMHFHKKEIKILADNAIKELITLEKEAKQTGNDKLPSLAKKFDAIIEKLRVGNSKIHYLGVAGGNLGRIIHNISLLAAEDNTLIMALEKQNSLLRKLKNRGR